jgi:DNA ligase-1
VADYIVHKAVELDNLSDKARNAIAEQQWIISPKYDGCHVVFCYAEGKHIATYSRTGETVHSMGHIATDLLANYPDIKTSERIAICGEAWVVGKEFNEISGMFRRHSPQLGLQFVPFDCIPFDWNDDTTSGPPVLLGQFNQRPYAAPYSARIGALMKREGLPTQVLLPRFFGVSGPLTHVKQLADQEAGRLKASQTGAYDGAVLAQANGLYKVGSGKGGEFIKCKPLLSETVVVTAVIADLGEKTGKHTCVLCFDLGGHIQKVSTGMTQTQANDWVADPSLIIDKRIEVEAMGITVNGFLREPRFKGLRIDA